MENDYLKYIILNENAYIFENPNRISLSKHRLNNLFRDASKGKYGNFLLKIVNAEYEINKTLIYYSFCVFKYQTDPSFITEKIKDWEETKLAYLLIFEIDNFIIISKKNIGGIQNFLNQIVPLDYKILSTIFIEEQTLFEKFSLKNMNVSEKALREKSLEAIDLKENFSTLGANSYILNNLRLSNNDEKISLALNTSRINKFGKKSSVHDFIDWSELLVKKIKDYKERETFLSIFAQPLEYEKEREKIIPIAVLFLFTKLYNDYENNHIVNSYYFQTNKKISFDLIGYLSKFERLCQIYPIIDNDQKIFKIKNKYFSDLEVKLNEKSITLRSLKLKNIILKKSDGTEISILDYVNQSNQFLINFDHVELIYTNRKLFKDNKLLGNIESFLKIFKPHLKLNLITSEKGRLNTKSTKFNDTSIFGFVEDEFINKSDYFICDDLGKEWADHIGLSNEKIMFFHSKCKSSNFSASAFQEVVGQAQKNLGNLSPQDFQLDSKKEFWNENYNNFGVNTKIKRLRKGENVEMAISCFKALRSNLYLVREVYLVINFISKAELEVKLNQLRDGEAFKERNEIIQILWFISSYILSCQEIGIVPYICCKP